MNINVIGLEGYYAAVTTSDGALWGVTIKEEHGNVFTIKLAEEILGLINREYKKGCPRGYWRESYDPNRTFTKLKYDMTNYRRSISDEGDEITVPIGKKKIGTYNQEKKLLRIWEDNMPIYENNNGVISKDQEALADCLM